MPEALQIAELSVDVARRPIRNMHLSVLPPHGRVSISVPENTQADLIRVFVLGKLAWIRKQQAEYCGQSRELLRQYITRESHFVWGTRYLLEVFALDEKPRVVLTGRKLTMFVRPEASRAAREALFDHWLRDRVREAALLKLPHLEAQLGVKVHRLFVQRMKTKWGSCNPEQGHIRLNSELARHPRSCLDYILLHETAHLVEPTHSARFHSLMDKHAAGWRENRSSLNRVIIYLTDHRFLCTLGL